MSLKLKKELWTYRESSILVNKMKKVLFVALLGVLSSFMLIGCRQETVVQAGNEPGQTETYQPRPAPTNDSNSPDIARNSAKSSDHEITGELIKVDVANNTIGIRAENGMEQPAIKPDRPGQRGQQRL